MNIWKRGEERHYVPSVFNIERVTINYVKIYHKVQHEKVLCMKVTKKLKCNFCWESKRTYINLNKYQ